MTQRQRLIGLGIFVLLMLGIGAYFLVNNSEGEQSDSPAPQTPTLENDSQPREPATLAKAAPKPETNDTPTPAAPMEVLPEPSPDGKTRLVVAFDAPAKYLSEVGATGRIVPHTKESFAAYSALDRQDSEAVDAYYKAYPNTTEFFEFDGTSKTFEIDAKYELCAFRLHPKFGSRSFLGLASTSVDHGHFEIDERNPTLGWGTWYFTKPVDRITYHYTEPATISGEVWLDGKALSKRFYSLSLLDPADARISYGRVSGLAAGEDEKVFTFSALPTGKEMLLSTSVDLRGGYGQELYPSRLRYELPLPALKIGEVRSGIKIEMPSMPQLDVKMLGADFAAQDWQVECEYSSVDESGSERQLGAWNRANRLADPTEFRPEPKFKRSSSFPIALNKQVVNHLLEEAWTSRAMATSDVDFMRFAAFIRNYTSSASLKITWKCYGYADFHETINAAEVFRRMLDGPRELAYTPSPHSFNASVRIVDRQSGEPIAGAWIDVPGKYGQASVRQVADERGQIELQAQGIGSVLEMHAGAENYYGDYQLLRRDGESPLFELDYHVKGSVEVFLQMPDGKPWSQKADGAPSPLGGEPCYRFSAETSSPPFEPDRTSPRPTIHFTGLHSGPQVLLVAVEGFRPLRRVIDIPRDNRDAIVVNMQLVREVPEERILDLSEYFKKLEGHIKIDQEDDIPLLRFINAGELLSLDIARLLDYTMTNMSTGSNGVYMPGLTLLGPTNPSEKVLYDSNSRAWLLGPLGEIVPLLDNGTRLVPDASKIGRIRGKLMNVQKSEQHALFLRAKSNSSARVKFYRVEMDYVIGSAADGSFEFPSVAAGDYLIYISRYLPDEGEAYDTLNAKKPIEVTITSNETKTVNITLN